MNTILKRKNLLVFLVLLVSFMAASPLPAGAQEQNEYFEYTITGELDKKSIQINEQFTARLSSHGVCKVDMPISIPSVKISIKIYARNKNQNSEVTLVPDYSIKINDIPTVKGKTFSVENAVSLIFPGDSPGGTYDVLVDITSAKFQVFGFWADGLEYMPANPIRINSIEVYPATTPLVNITPDPTSSPTPVPATEKESSITPGSINISDHTAIGIDQNSHSSDDNSRWLILGLITGFIVSLLVLGSILFMIRVKRKRLKS